MAVKATPNLSPQQGWGTRSWLLAIPSWLEYSGVVSGEAGQGSPQRQERQAGPDWSTRSSSVEPPCSLGQTFRQGPWTHPEISQRHAPFLLSVYVWPAVVSEEVIQDHEKAFEDCGGSRADGWDLHQIFFTIYKTNPLFLLQHFYQFLLWKRQVKGKTAFEALMVMINPLLFLNAPSYPAWLGGCSPRRCANHAVEGSDISDL